MGRTVHGALITPEDLLDKMIAVVKKNKDTYDDSMEIMSDMHGTATISSFTDKENFVEIALYHGFSDIFPKAYKDVSKIQFDCENFYASVQSGMKGCGAGKFNNGLAILLCCAGGDWETPVYFILYFDGKDIRGYVPTEGNLFDKKAKVAFGNEGDYYNLSDTDLDKMIEYNASLEYDYAAMEKDIIDRITICI